MKKTAKKQIWTASLVLVLATMVGLSSCSDGDTIIVGPQGFIYIAAGHDDNGGKLFRLDLSDPFSGLEEIGDMTGGGDGVEALALSPLGVVYAVETGYDDEPNLYTVNLTTGALTLIGLVETGDTDDDPDCIAGLAFVGGMLYGLEGGTNPARFYRINTSDASAELIGTVPTTSYYGNSIAAMSNGQIVAASYSDSEERYLTFSPTAPADAEDGEETVFGSVDSYGVSDMTYVGDDLIGIEVDDDGGGSDDYPSYLVSIDLETGENTIIRELPGSLDLSSLVFVP